MSRLWKLAVVAVLPIAMAFSACEDNDTDDDAFDFNDDDTMNDTFDDNGLDDDMNGPDDTFNDDGLDDTFDDDDGLD
jgi:hypothetical protein